MGIFIVHNEQSENVLVHSPMQTSRYPQFSPAAALSPRHLTIPTLACQKHYHSYAVTPKYFRYGHHHA